MHWEIVGDSRTSRNRGEKRSGSYMLETELLSFRDENMHSAGYISTALLKNRSACQMVTVCFNSVVWITSKHFT